MEYTYPSEIHIAAKQSTPVRLSDYAIGIFDRITSKSALKKAIKKELITVDGISANTGIWIRGGERIELSPELIAVRSPPSDILIRVLYEDDYLAVIHKPSGTIVSGNTARTIAHALPLFLKRSNQVDATLPRPVHRLDRGTSGVLLVGKTVGAIQTLNGMFETKEINKTYTAITIGVMEPHGEVANPIDGKPSHTIYKVMESVTSERFQHLNLVELSPLTGRRHQLRKHMSHIGNPILGDREYAKEGLELKGKGMYLHANQLMFIHPFLKKELSIIDRIPSKFEKIFPKVKM